MSEIHSVGPFILGKSLGAGATGKVKLGFHKDTGFKVAIKIMNKEVLSSRPSMRKKVEREIVVMKLIDHPNILKLHDVYETSKYLFLVTEYVEGGELFDYLINKGSLEPAEALKFFQQIIRGLDHCHSQRICHRDLKPENLLLDADRNMKIGDFGMAALMRRGALLSTSCGSPHYASPEVVTGKHYSGMTADIWSCGVILYALLTFKKGKLPFDDDDIRKLLGKVKSGAFTMPAFLHVTAQDLIQRMLTVDPTKRITMSQIKEHKWFTSNMPDPTSFSCPISVEDMPAEPLTDVSTIDDEILRSLKVLGLGSDLDIEHSLSSKIPNLTLVFYRLLQDRKEKQSNNNYNHRASRNRSNTHDMRERSYSEHTQGRSHQEGKARSNSFTQQEGNNGVSRVLSLHSKQRRPSPLVDAKRGVGSQGLIFPLSPSNSSASSPTSTFSVSDETATIVSLAGSGSELAPLTPLSPRTSPLINPPNNLNLRMPSPSMRDKDKDKYKKFSQSPPPSPPMLSLQGGPGESPSSPISISTKSRVMKLASEGTTSPLGSSPIIGSNPKRSWFSNFFTGSPHTTSLLDEEDAGPNLTIRDSQSQNNHPPHPSHSPHQSHSSHSPHQSPQHSHHSHYSHNHHSHHSHHSLNHSSYSPSPNSSRHHNNHNNNNNYNTNNNNYNNNHNNINKDVNNNNNNNTPHHTTQTGFHIRKTNSTEDSPPTSPTSKTSPAPTKPDLQSTSQTTSPESKNRDNTRATIEMHTGKSGIELGAEIQRTLCALKTSWRLHTNELYTAKYDGAEGHSCQFSVELVDLKADNTNLISLSHLAGTSSFFDTLCSQFQAEVKL